MIFIWLEFRDRSYIYKKRCGTLYGLKWLGMMLEDVMQIFIYLMKFLNFRTHFSGTSKNENKIGKNILFEVL